jgi:hypothetical protein
MKAVALVTAFFVYIAKVDNYHSWKREENS